MAKKYTKLMTKDEVVTELRRLQGEGHTMKLKDFDNNLKYSIRENFGGYKAVRNLLGIKSSLNGNKSRRRYTEEFMEKELRKASALSDYLGEVYDRIGAGVTSAIFRDHEGIQSFASMRGIKLPPKKSRSNWTEEDIKSELLEVYETKGNIPSMRWFQENGKAPLVRAVKKYYGTWNEGIVHFGYEPFCATGKTDWTPEELVDRALGEISEGAVPTRKGLAKRIRGFDNQVSRLFGSYDEFKRRAGYCVISTDRPRKERPVDKGYRANLRTKEGLKREILRLWYIGFPLNYQAIKSNRRHLIESARDLFGGWRNAIEYSGIDYESICVSDNRLSEAGTEFEELLGEILTELGVKYEKYAHETLEPDFVLPNGEWLDAKLSEWTDHTETLKRYLPECRQLTIVYLRGSKTDKMVGAKYRHRKLSVYKLTEKLDESRRNYYENKLAEIETEIKAA